MSFEQQFIEAIEKRLPSTDFLSVADVAAALNVSRGKVLAHCECGHFCAANDSTGEKANYAILRASVVGFYRRQLGMKDETEKQEVKA